MKNMNKNTFKVIQHQVISQKDLDDIISIKSIAWPFNYEEQLNWITRNISDCDYHLILYSNNEPVGYLNLVNIELFINQITVNALGVGNVCTKVHAKGYGKDLLLLLNDFLIQNQKIGLLFCRDNLVNFYAKYEWRIVSENLIKLAVDNIDVNTMIFNNKEYLKKIEYKGRLF